MTGDETPAGARVEPPGETGPAPASPGATPLPRLLPCPACGAGAFLNADDDDLTPRPSPYEAFGKLSDLVGGSLRGLDPVALTRSLRREEEDLAPLADLDGEDGAEQLDAVLGRGLPPFAWDPSRPVTVSTLDLEDEP